MHDDLLALESRRRLFQHLRRNPGQFLRELQRELGMGMGVLEHHLDLLVRQGLVTVEVDGQKRFYPVEVAAPDRTLLGFLRQAIPRQVLMALASGPLPRGEVVARLGLAPSTVQYHLQRLADSGLVSVQKGGRDAVYQLERTDDVVRLLVWYRSSFLDRLVDAFVEGAEGMRHAPAPPARPPGAGPSDEPRP